MPTLKQRLQDITEKFIKTQKPLTPASEAIKKMQEEAVKAGQAVKEEKGK